METKENKQQHRNYAIGLAIGIPIGMPVGLAMGNLALGPIIGLIIGLLLGFVFNARENLEDHSHQGDQKRQKKIYAYLLILGIVLFVEVLFFWI